MRQFTRSDGLNRHVVARTRHLTNIRCAIHHIPQGLSKLNNPQGSFSSSNYIQTRWTHETASNDTSMVPNVNSKSILKEINVCHTTRNLFDLYFDLNKFNQSSPLKIYAAFFQQFRTISRGQSSRRRRRSRQPIDNIHNLGEEDTSRLLDTLAKDTANCIQTKLSLPTTNQVRDEEFSRALVQIAQNIPQLYRKPSKTLISAIGKSLSSQKFVMDSLESVLMMRAFADAKLLTPTVYSLLKNVIIDKQDNLNAQQISMAMYTLGAVRISDAELYDVLIQQAIRHKDSFTEQGVANVFWSCARSGMPTQSVFREMLTRCTQLLPEFTAQGFANISWAFAITNGSQDPLVLQLIQGPLQTEFVRRVKRWGIEPTTNYDKDIMFSTSITCWALHKAGGLSYGTAVSVADLIQQRADLLKSAQTADIIRLVHSLSHTTSELLKSSNNSQISNVLCRMILELVDQSDARQLSRGDAISLLHALPSVQNIASHPQFVSLCRNEYNRELSDCLHKMIGNVARQVARQVSTLDNYSLVISLQSTGTSLRDSAPSPQIDANSQDALWEGFTTSMDQVSLRASELNVLQLATVAHSISKTIGHLYQLPNSHVSTFISDKTVSAAADLLAKIGRLVVERGFVHSGPGVRSKSADSGQSFPVSNAVHQASKQIRLVRQLQTDRENDVEAGRKLLDVWLGPSSKSLELSGAVSTLLWSFANALKSKAFTTPLQNTNSPALHVNSELFSLLAAHTELLAPVMTPQSLSNAAFAFASVGVPAVDASTAIAMEMLERGSSVAADASNTPTAYSIGAHLEIAGFSPDFVSSMTWAFSQQGLADVQLYEALSTYAARHLEQENCTDDANRFTYRHANLIAWSSACAGVYHVDFLTKLASKLRNTRPSDLTEMEYAQLYATYLSAQATLPDEVFSGSVYVSRGVDGTNLDDETYSLSGVSAIANRLNNHFHLREPEHVKKQYQHDDLSIHAHQKEVDSIRLPFKHRPLSGQETTQQSVRLSLPSHVQELAARAYLKLHSATVSNLQKNVVSLLHSLDVHNYQQEYLTQDHVSLDIAWPKDHVALEINGPSHFLLGFDPPVVSLSTRLKQRILQARGWDVRNLHFYEWSGRTAFTKSEWKLSPEEQAQLLRSKLPAYLFTSGPDKDINISDSFSRKKHRTVAQALVDQDRHGFFQAGAQAAYNSKTNDSDGISNSSLVQEDSNLYDPAMTMKAQLEDSSQVFEQLEDITKHTGASSDNKVQHARDYFGLNAPTARMQDDPLYSSFSEAMIGTTMHEKANKEKESLTKETQAKFDSASKKVKNTASFISQQDLMLPKSLQQFEAQVNNTSSTEEDAVGISSSFDLQDNHVSDERSKSQEPQPLFNDSESDTYFSSNHQNHGQILADAISDSDEAIADMKNVGQQLSQEIEQYNVQLSDAELTTSRNAMEHTSNVFSRPDVTAELGRIAESGIFSDLEDEPNRSHTRRKSRSLLDVFDNEHTADNSLQKIYGTNADFPDAHDSGKGNVQPMDAKHKLEQQTHAFFASDLESGTDADSFFARGAASAYLEGDEISANKARLRAEIRHATGKGDTVPFGAGIEAVKSGYAFDHLSPDFEKNARLVDQDMEKSKALYEQYQAATRKSEEGDNSLMEKFIANYEETFGSDAFANEFMSDDQASDSDVVRSVNDLSSRDRTVIKLLKHDLRNRKLTASERQEAARHLQSKLASFDRLASSETNDPSSPTQFDVDKWEKAADFDEQQDIRALLGEIMPEMLPGKSSKPQIEQNSNLNTESSLDMALPQGATQDVTHNSQDWIDSLNAPNVLAQTEEHAFETAAEQHTTQGSGTNTNNEFEAQTGDDIMTTVNHVAASTPTWFSPPQSRGRARKPRKFQKLSEVQAQVENSTLTTTHSVAKNVSTANDEALRMPSTSETPRSEHSIAVQQSDADVVESIPSAPVAVNGSNYTENDRQSHRYADHARQLQERTDQKLIDGSIVKYGRYKSHRANRAQRQDKQMNEEYEKTLELGHRHGRISQLDEMGQGIPGWSDMTPAEKEMQAKRALGAVMKSMQEQFGGHGIDVANLLRTVDEAYFGGLGSTPGELVAKPDDPVSQIRAQIHRSLRQGSPFLSDSTSATQDDGDVSSLWKFVHTRQMTENAAKVLQLDSKYVSEELDTPGGGLMFQLLRETGYGTTPEMRRYISTTHLDAEDDTNTGITTQSDTNTSRNTSGMQLTLRNLDEMLGLNTFRDVIDLQSKSQEQSEDLDAPINLSSMSESDFSRLVKQRVESVRSSLPSQSTDATSTESMNNDASNELASSSQLNPAQIEKILDEQDSHIENNDEQNFRLHDRDERSAGEDVIYGPDGLVTTKSELEAFQRLLMGYKITEDGQVEENNEEAQWQALFDTFAETATTHGNHSDVDESDVDQQYNDPNHMDEEILTPEQLAEQNAAIEKEEARLKQALAETGYVSPRTRSRAPRDHHELDDAEAALRTTDASVDQLRTLLESAANPSGANHMDIALHSTEQQQNRVFDEMQANIDKNRERVMQYDDSPDMARPDAGFDFMQNRELEQVFDMESENGSHESGDVNTSSGVWEQMLQNDPELQSIMAKVKAQGAPDSEIHDLFETARAEVQQTMSKSNTDSLPSNKSLRRHGVAAARSKAASKWGELDDSDEPAEGRLWRSGTAHGVRRARYSKSSSFRKPGPRKPT